MGPWCHRGRPAPGISDARREWGWFAGPDPLATRRRLRAFKWAITVFFLLLGLATLAAYMKIGIEHAPNYGEHYVPTWLQEGAP